MTVKATLLAAALGIVAASLSAQADVPGPPRRGGTFTFGVGGEPPGLDCHAGNSYVILNFVAPHYSLLLRYDPPNYPRIEGDAAAAWTVSPDGLVYRFTLRPDVLFHDGSRLTSEDVKATYERLRRPPPGVISVRQSDFADIEAIEAPDPLTVVFRLKQPNEAMLTVFANPWNCLYSAKRLAENPQYPATQVFGSGPFLFDQYVRGSHWTGKRFDRYFRPGEPYLDGFKAIPMASAALVNALSGGGIDGSFQQLGPQEIGRITAARGERSKFLAGDIIVQTMVAFNVEKAPLNDPRVRQALNLAIDRHGGIGPLARITNLHGVGGLFRPSYELATAPAELARLPGFGDINAARAEARRLLAEAGVPNLQIKLHNRTTNIPYLPLGIFVVDQWRQIGVRAEVVAIDPGIYHSTLTNSDFDAAIDFNNPSVDEPSLLLAKYLPGNGINYSRSKDAMLADLYARQKLAGPDERRTLLAAFERRLYEQAYVAPLFWAQRTVAFASDVHGWTPTPSFFIGQDLGTVWMSR